MKKIFDVVKASPLFNGIGISDFQAMTTCMDSRFQDFKKGQIILLSGNPVDYVGLVVSGSIQVLKDDLLGKQNILIKLSAPELFGEVFACAGVSHSPVTVIAAEDATIFFLNYKRIVSACSSACPFHTKLIENMLRLMSQKNLMLNQKIEILSKRTTRERLLMFFDLKRGISKKFAIPYNREELAAYLCVDRSAMSNELSKMRDEGIITFNKNKFEIL